MRLVVAAVSLDGFISPDGIDCSLDWTCKEDKKVWRRLSREKAWDLHVIGGRTWTTLVPSYRRHIAGKTLAMARPEDDLGDPAPTKRGGPDEIAAVLSGAGNILVMGGSTVYSIALQLGLFDELALVHQPCLLGRGVPLARDVNERLDLELIETATVGQAHLSRYKRRT